MKKFLSIVQMWLMLTLAAFGYDLNMHGFSVVDVNQVISSNNIVIKQVIIDVDTSGGGIQTSWPGVTNYIAASTNPPNVTGGNVYSNQMGAGASWDGGEWNFNVVPTNAWDSTLLQQDAGATCWVGSVDGPLCKIIPTNSPTTLAVIPLAQWSNRTATVRVNVPATTNIILFASTNLVTAGNGSYTSVVFSATEGTSLLFDHNDFTNDFNVYQFPRR